MEPQLKSNRQRYYHHGQYHGRRQSYTGSTNSTLAVMPVLGVGLLLCGGSSQGNELLYDELIIILVPCVLFCSFSLSLPLSSSLDVGWKFTRAAREGNVQTMKRLLRSGIDVNCRHPLGWTALHTAVVNANWPVIEFLIENGVDINGKDEFSSAQRMAAQEKVSSTQGMYSKTCIPS